MCLSYKIIFFILHTERAAQESRAGRDRDTNQYYGVKNRVTKTIVKSSRRRVGTRKTRAYENGPAVRALQYSVLNQRS